MARFKDSSFYKALKEDSQRMKIFSEEVAKIYDTPRPKGTSLWADWKAKSARLDALHDAMYEEVGIGYKARSSAEFGKILERRQDTQTVEAHIQADTQPSVNMGVQVASEHRSKASSMSNNLTKERFNDRKLEQGKKGQAQESQKEAGLFDNILSKVRSISKGIARDRKNNPYSPSPDTFTTFGHILPESQEPIDSRGDEQTLEQPKTQQQGGNSKGDLLQDIRNFKKSNLRHTDVGGREASIARDSPSPLGKLSDLLQDTRNFKKDNSDVGGNEQTLEQPKTQQQGGNSKGDLLQDIRNFKKSNLRHTDVGGREASLSWTKRVTEQQREKDIKGPSI